MSKQPWRRHRQRRLAAELLLPVAGTLCLLGMVGAWLLGGRLPGQGQAICAQDRQVQLAFGSARGKRAVSAELRHPPLPGSMLLAIVRSRDENALPVPEGWTTVIDELEKTPGQAMYYRFVTGKEGDTISFHGFERRSRLGLEVHEYQGIDSQFPVLAASSSSGAGMALGSGVIGMEEKAVAVAALATDIRTFFSSGTPGISLCHQAMTSGSGSISVASYAADSEAPGQFGVEAHISGASGWIGQAVALRRSDVVPAVASDVPFADLSVEIVSSLDKVHSEEEIAFDVTAMNHGPDDASGIEITAALPRGMRFLGAQAPSGTTYAPISGSWRIGELAVGEGVVLHVTADVDIEANSGPSIITATVTDGDQPDPNPENGEAADAFEIEKTPMSVFGCPEIDEIGLEINGGAETIDGPRALVSAFASGATHVLLGETVEARDAVYAPLGETVPFTFSGEPGKKTLYAWFGNACQRAFVQSVDVEMRAEAVPVPPAAEEETGAPGPLENEWDFPEAEDGVLVEGPSGDLAWEGCVTYATFPAGLGLGDKGPEVAELQQLMTCFGLFPATSPVDGRFGIQTQRALVDFQGLSGIEVTGSLNAETIDALAPYMLTP